MHEKYKHILVAVDGSDNSHLAFKHGVEVAKRNEATLYVLQVINDQNGTQSPFAYGKIIEEEQKRADEEMAAYLAYAKNHRFTQLESIVKIGNPKNMIARTVPEEYKIDLIMIGATGKGMVNRLLIGSTTNYVVQHAKCNILVVKDQEV